MTKDDKAIFICACSSFEHQAIFWEDDEFGGMHVYIHLVPNRPFFQRLLAGLKYAFGYRSRFGEYDEFLFEEAELERLKKFLNK